MWASARTARGARGGSCVSPPTGMTSPRGLGPCWAPADPQTTKSKQPCETVCLALLTPGAPPLRNLLTNPKAPTNERLTMVNCGGVDPIDATFLKVSPGHRGFWGAADVQLETRYVLSDACLSKTNRNRMHANNRSKATRAQSNAMIVHIMW